MRETFDGDCPESSRKRHSDAHTSPVSLGHAQLLISLWLIAGVAKVFVPQARMSLKRAARQCPGQHPP